MALPDLELIVQQHMQLSKEQREIEDEFNRQEQHELAALDEAKRAIDAKWKVERESMISQLPGQMPLPEAFEALLSDKRNALLALKDETYQRERTERNRRLEDDKRKLAHKWSTLLPSSISALSLGEAPKSVSEAPKPQPPGQVPPRVVEAPARAAEAPPHVTEAPGQPAARPVAVTPSHLPGVLQAPVAVPAPFLAQGTLMAPPHAPYHPPNASFQGPPAARPFPSSFAHLPSSHQLPTPPTVPSQAIPPPPQQHRKPLPTGSQQPPTRIQPQPTGPQQPPPGAFPSVERNGAQFPPRPVLVGGPQESGPGFKLPRNLHGGDLQAGPSEARPSAYVVPVIVEPSAPIPSLGQHHDAQPLKRRSEDFSGSSNSQSKRARVESSEKTHGGEMGQSPGRQRAASQRTITFHEVYGNGEATYKHHIVEYPPHSNKFYILKCEEHGVHFNANPLAGAAKHLHSAQHGNMTKERAQAVELLGYQVVDCTMELASKNNELFRQLLAIKQYLPLNMNQASKTVRRSMGFADTPDAAPPKAAASESQLPPPLPALLPRHSRGGTFSGITDPKAGELYLAYWKKDKKNYVVMILPWGNLECAGMIGSLSGTGLLERAPKCYRIDSITGQITGWNPDVDETKREFPVMYFDGRTSVGWVRAKDLSQFDFDDRNWKEIPYFKDAKEHYAKVRGYTTYQHMVDSRPDGPPSHPPKHIGVTTIAGPPAPPPEDHEMTNSGAAPVADDSDVDSASKAASDSDSDVEMANTESRRTSVSNRGEVPDQNEKAAAQAESRWRTPAQEPVSNARQPSPGPLEAGDETSAGMSGSRSIATLAQTAQLAMAKTSPVSGAPSTDPRTGWPKAPDQGNRRVEKIYAHSNPNRSSRSPRVHTTSLPDRRADAAAPQSAAAPQQIPRVPSPASLQNIVHGQSNEQPSRPAAPYQAGYLAEPQDARRGPSPLQHPLASAEPLAGRVLEAPAPATKARIPSPLQMPSRLVSQSAQQLNSGPGPLPKPDSRGSAPVIVRIDSAAAQDRWRAVRAEAASGSTPGSQIPNPLPTPNPSSAGTQPDSPGLQDKRSPSISVKPLPNLSVKQGSPTLAGTASKEVFDVGLLVDPENPDTSQIKETVRLAIDPETQTARTQPGSATTTVIVVDPSKLSTIQVGGGNSARVMKLVYRDGQKQTLVFRASDVGHGVQNGFIHARRFSRWVTAVDSSVEYLNNNSTETPGRRSESVIVVE